MYDVCIIGAGTSGLMASIASSAMGASTVVLDKNKMAGKKLRLTGGGRCNVTNQRPVDDVIAHIPGNGKFLYSAFSQFDNEDIRAFFENHGVHLVEEDHGRLFPHTHSAKTIVNTLVDTAKAQGVSFEFQAEVEKLITDNERVTGVRLTDGRDIRANSVIIATGGITYRYTGSTGDGYQFAKQVGHHITPLYPTEAPLVSEAAFIKAKTLQGISLRDVALSVIDDKGKTVVTHQMDLLFTHFGLSGPCALRCSMFVNQLLKNQETVTVRLNLKPEMTPHDWMQFFKQTWQQDGNKSIKNAWHTFTQERYLLFLLQQADIDPNKPLKQLTKDEALAFQHYATALDIPIKRTWPLEKAFVTGGGIQLKEVNPKTMESKKCAGLYFCGEVLDVNGYTGGYNITAAFSTGYVAGLHAAETSFYFK